MSGQMRRCAVPGGKFRFFEKTSCDSERLSVDNVSPAALKRGSGRQTDFRGIAWFGRTAKQMRQIVRGAP